MQESNISNPSKLAFLKTLTSFAGVSYTELATMLGVPQSRVLYWIEQDDIYVDLVEKICSILGYRFSLRLEASSTFTPPNHRVKTSTMARRCEQGLLPFLSGAMARLGITERDLAGALNISQTVINHMFKSNRIRFSRILEIARAFHLVVRVEIFPATNGAYESSHRRIIMTFEPITAVFDYHDNS